MSQAHVVRHSDYKIEQVEGAELTWWVSGQQGTSKTMTIGTCRLAPGAANPLHFHPNCDEVLHVLQGRIVHSMEHGRSVELQEGETISIPQGVPHHARNIGQVDALLLICFSSSDRQAVLLGE